MSNELQQQEALKNLLQIEYDSLNIPAKVYAKNEFKRIDANANKRPDLIIINSPKIFHRILSKSDSIEPPIGIEYKKRLGTTQFIRAVKLQAQDRYQDGKYLIRENNKEINLNTVSFSNQDLIKYGHYSGDLIERFDTLKICYQNEKCLNEIIFIEDMWAERVCWAFDMPLLVRRNNSFIWSYRNYFFDLSGKEVACYGKEGKLIKY